MRKFGRVAVPFLLSLLALPPTAVAKHAVTSPATGAPDAAPSAPPGERKPLLQQIRENPTKFGDSPSENRKDYNMHGKLPTKSLHAAKTDAPKKKVITQQTPAPSVPPKTVQKHVLQDVKENPTKYNDALNKIPGKKDRPEDQH
ncbi:MAG TPA: hypothetical protein V6C69_19350 [Trichormus sp.]|jgi:hypothetical protein